LAVWLNPPSRNIGSRRAFDEQSPFSYWFSKKKNKIIEQPNARDSLNLLYFRQILQLCLPTPRRGAWVLLPRGFLTNRIDVEVAEERIWFGRV
jgi:hypothetical protein